MRHATGFFWKKRRWLLHNLKKSFKIAVTITFPPNELCVSGFTKVMEKAKYNFYFNQHLFVQLLHDIGIEQGGNDNSDIPHAKELLFYLIIQIIFVILHTDKEAAYGKEEIPHRDSGF